MTLKEVCEEIEKSQILIRADGRHPTAREIYEYSPTGELIMLNEWYEIAKVVNQKKAALSQ